MRAIAPVEPLRSSLPGSLWPAESTCACWRCSPAHFRATTGAVRSAAADWSIYPVGTVFQIEGNPALYVVDDYGSALVGTRTIDLYKPSLSYVSRWGVRRVNITILKWGSFAKSLAILKPRENKAPHVRQMVARLEARSA